MEKQNDYQRQENQSSDVDNAVRLTRQQYAGRKISREGLKEIVKGAIAIESAEQRRKDERRLDALFAKPSACNLPASNQEKPAQEGFSFDTLEKIAMEVNISSSAICKALREYDETKAREISDAECLVLEDNKKRRARKENIKACFLGAAYAHILPTLLRKGITETAQEHGLYDSNFDIVCASTLAVYMFNTVAYVCTLPLHRVDFSSLKYPLIFFGATTALSLGYEIGRWGIGKIKEKLEVRRARKFLEKEGVKL